MKTRVFILFTLIIILVMAVYCQSNAPKTNNKNQLISNGNILDFYRQYSSFTDPGEYEYLYKISLNLYQSFAD